MHSSSMRLKGLLSTVRRFTYASTVGRAAPLKSAGPQLMQVRHHAPIAGPPRYRLSTAQKIIYGWGSLVFMMVIPYWCLFQMPRWSALHNGRPWNEDEEEPKEPTNMEDQQQK